MGITAVNISSDYFCAKISFVFYLDFIWGRQKTLKKPKTNTITKNITNQSMHVPPCSGCCLYRDKLENNDTECFHRLVGMTVKLTWKKNAVLWGFTIKKQARMYSLVIYSFSYGVISCQIQTWEGSFLLGALGFFLVMFIVGYDLFPRAVWNISFIWLFTHEYKPQTKPLVSSTKCCFWHFGFSAKNVIFVLGLSYLYFVVGKGGWERGSPCGTGLIMSVKLCNLQLFLILLLYCSAPAFH